MCEKVKEEEGMPPLWALILSNLGALYNDLGQFEKAELHFQTALTINEQALGVEHPRTQDAVKNYALLLRMMHCDDEAAKIEIRYRKHRK